MIAATRYKIYPVDPPTPPPDPADGVNRSIFNFFQNIVMFHIKLKGN